MWRRFSLAIGLSALVTALGVSSSFAATAQDTFGYSSLGGIGDAYVLILPSGDTHVQVRLKGQTPGSQPVAQVLTGSTCGGAVGTAVIGPTAPLTISSLGVSMTAGTYSVVLPVAAGVINYIAVRVYSSISPSGVLGPEIGCGQIKSVPDNGTQHWW